MSETTTDNGGYTAPPLISSCCGQTYNEISYDIVDNIFVEDSFVKSEAISWIQKNLNNYKFVGKNAKNLKKRLQGLSASNLYSDDIDSLLSEFFSMFANNPYCAENGICILEDSFIVGKKLDCYFVLYKNDIIIPIGALKLFVHDLIKPVKRDFLDKSRRSAMKASYQSSICFEEMDTNLPILKNLRLANIPRFILGLATFVLSLFYVIFCIISIDWTNIGHYTAYSNDFFQAIRFAAEEGFNITHNSNLSLLLLGIGIYWLLHLLFRNIKFIKEFKNSKNANKLKRVRKSLGKVRKELPEIDKNFDKSKEFVNENFESFNKIFLTPFYSERKFGPAIIELGENRNLVFSDNMKQALPKTFRLIISLCLIIATLFFAGQSTKDGSFKATMIDALKSETVSGSSTALHAVNSSITISDANVYTQCNPNSLVLYHVDAGTKVTVVDDFTSEEYSKISFLTDEGVINGWIYNESIVPYNPEQDKALYKNVPIEVDASSALETDGYVPNNTIDGKLGTVWQEGAEGAGSGEWISYYFGGESTQISSIAIYNGDARSEELYYKNARAVEVKINFYENEDSISETLTYYFEDGVREMIYINLNKPVKVTSLDIELVSISEEYYYPDACISEVEFYCVNPDVQ